MQFQMTFRDYPYPPKPTEFTELNAPDWLTSKNTVPGSTMDNRWFWNDHILTLKVGQSKETDFRIITRIA